MQTPTSFWSRPIVLYDGFRDNVPDAPAFEDEDLVALLTQFDDEPSCDPATCPGRECPSKVDGLSWSPVSYKQGATRRGDDGVASVNYAVFDVDKVDDPDAVAGMRARLDAEGLEYVLHTTHSHAPEREAWRLVLPLSRPLEPAEWPAVHDALIAALALPVKDKCGDTSRLWGCPLWRAGVRPQAHHHRGQAVDVEDALAAAEELGIIKRQPSAADLMRVAPQPAPTTDLATLREALAQARRSKANGDDREKAQAELLRRCLEGEALGEPGGLHAARLSLCGMLGRYLPVGTPWEAALQLLGPMLRATPVAPGTTYEETVEKTRQLYEDSSAWRVQIEAERQKAMEARRILVEKGRGKPVVAAASAAAAAGEDWQSLLQVNSKGVLGNELNAQLVLSCAEELRGTIAWDDVSKDIVIRGGPFAFVPRAVLPQAVAAWMQQHYNFLGGAKLVGPALLQVAYQNAFNPIQDYLEELSWDKRPRADRFFVDYFGAEDTPYVRAVGRRWLISLVARAMRPGCKCDTVLILEGKQGLGKSTALQLLVGGPRWFLDTALELGNKDTMQAIASSWLIELGELASFRRAEQDRTKQFLSSQTDRFRPPYGHGVEESPRRCVLCGTTNEGEYLRDRTGNRRYLPVKCTRIDLEGIKRDRDLLLGEAMVAFRDGERWHLEGAEAEAQAEETEARLEGSSTEEAVRRWWYAMLPAKRPRRFGMLDVAEMALAVALDRVDHRLRSEIGAAMRRLGFEYKQVREDGRKVRVFEPTAELLEAPRAVPASQQRALSLVRGLKEKAE